MKTFTTIILLLLTLSLSGQSAYEKAMQKGLELIATDKLAASQQFERICRVEKDNWLPPYYAAFCQVESSWGQFSKEQTLQSMEKAQQFIDEASVISPDNPEIMVLQGMLNTCWITYDSKTYGMKLSAATTAIYEKALAIDPENPRVVLNRARWLMGSARFFGKDFTPYCGEVERAITLLQKEESSGFDPSWGLESAQEVQKECEQYKK
ncbi:tetratricopeptide repeat protein [Nonlabens xiamenensis]|uniref:tetratricopeptide repeat protein n=1 Tax=Nonlabens xiamenensis TaxID=2341043 RepID=UPI000F60BD9D|nr:hypothetical protein [Nonlabens xiamenensis]